MLLREFFLRRFNLFHPPNFLAKCIRFPTMDCFRKRERREVDDGGGGVIGGSDDGDKSVWVTSLS